MSLNLDPAFLLSSRAYGLKRESAIWVKRIVAGVWSKGKNTIWVKRIVAGIWSEREKHHLGQKSGLYGLQDTK